MNIIKNILKSEIKFIGFYFLNTVVMIFTFNQLLNTTYLFYPIVLSITIFCGYLVLQYIKYKKLMENKNNLLIPNFEPEYQREFYDQFYLDIIKNLHFDYGRDISQLSDKSKRNSLLFSQFIHNMKTSVSVIDLAVVSENSHKLEDIRVENTKLKEQLEQSLNILRLDQFSKDYIPAKNDLLEILRSVINSNKSNFIYNKIYPKISDDITEEQIFVMTDKKWCTYIINQVVLNAIKYSESEKNIYFNIFKRDKSIVLQIVDNGVGIPPQDIDRVFELFYTGENGRDNVNATGIGLTMVKNVAKLLGHEVNISSVVNEGTTFEITFLTKM